MNMEAQTVINFDRLSKEFITRNGDSFLAVDNISLEIPGNSFTCIVGPSGCGKSTLLRIAAGLEKSSRGTVLYKGNGITGPKAEVGMVFQEYSLFPWLNVLDNVAAGLDFAGMEKKERYSRAEHFIRMINMIDFKNSYPHELSGGMRQRVAIARALANDPDVLLMDEPFGALDAHTRILLQKELLKVWEMTRKTIVLVTHSVDEAIYLADKIVIMSSRPGRINEVLNVDMERPRSRSMPEFGRLTDFILKKLEH